MSTQTITSNIHILPDGRMTPPEAARYLGLSPKTLATWRCLGKGPAFVKRGRVFYFKHDLDEWVAAGSDCRSTAQARAR